MPLTIVTYHYVRELQNSRYPTIKGRDIAEFKAQLDHIERHFEVVSSADVVGACKGENELPRNALWLTFDDGYLDHFVNVLPLLHARKLHGAFFPTVNTVVRGELLDVNKVHFIRAAQPDTGPIIAAMKSHIDARGGQDGVEPFEAYWQAHARPGRYDPAEVMFMKAVLQHALPETERNVLVDELFARFVSVDQMAFARELYMTEEQLRMLLQCGMYVGPHGTRHYWLDRMSEDEQATEISTGLDFMRRLGAPTTDWVMCYPYGASDEKLRALLGRKACAVGLTVESGVVEIGRDDPLLLRRRDTNELPIV